MGIGVKIFLLPSCLLEKTKRNIDNQAYLKIVNSVKASTNKLKKYCSDLSLLEKLFYESKKISFSLEVAKVFLNY
jgi:hypothetical protein